MSRKCVFFVKETFPVVDSENPLEDGEGHRPVVCGIGHHHPLMEPCLR